MSKLYRSLLWSGLVVAGVAACGDDVTVTPPAPPPPPTNTAATISIRSITTGSLNTPVLLSNVQGQIDVTLNLDAGTQTVSNVQVLIDGAVACQQGFSAISAAPADQTALDVVPVVCSINTADFNPTTGIATYLNGTRLLTAKVNLVGSAPVATPSTTLIFNNESIIAVTTSVVNGATANRASDGLLWQTGDLTAVALPVIYTAGAPAIQQIVLLPDCGMSPAVLTTAPYTFTWLKADLIADGGAGGCEQQDFHIDVSSTVGGAVGPNCCDSPDFNFDNKGPGAPTFIANPNGRRNGWINATVGLAGSNTSATDNDWLLNGAPDGGVGGYTRKLRIGSGAGAVVDAALAAAASATPTLPAPTLTNGDQCAVASATDALGNESDLPVDGDDCLQILTTDPSFLNTGESAILFGVDIDAPTIAFSGGLASNSRINTPAVGGEFQVTVADVGAIGNSGMLSGAAVVGTVERRAQGVTPPSGGSCFIGSFSGGACNPVSINVAPPFPLVATTTVAASVLTGYFAGSFVAQDAAGNQSAPVTRVVAHDDAVNLPALTSALFNVPLGGGTAVFNANASDNFDLWTALYTMTYAGGVLAANPLVFPTVVLNTFNTPPLVNSNVSAGITVTGFMRQVQDVTGNAPLAATAGFKPTNLDGVVTDQSNTPSATASTPIPGASVTAGVDFLTASAPQLIDSWSLSNGAASISNGAGPAGPANPTSVTLNADVFGPTATFNPPFSVVNFFIVSGGNLVQIGSAPGSSSTVDDGSPNGRRHRYTFTWTPGAGQPVGVVTIYAIGVSAAGDGLTTLANTNITITNP